MLNRSSPVGVKLPIRRSCRGSSERGATFRTFRSWRSATTRGPGLTVSQHLTTAARACAVSRSKGLAMFDGQAEAALQVSRAHLVDLTSLYCTATACPPVIGHVLVYKDRTHLTATFAATLSPYIERQVVAAIAR